MASIVWFVWFQSGIQIQNPKPLSPANHRLDGESVIFQEQGWQCQVRPMDGNDLTEHIRELGVSQAVLDHEGLRKTLYSMAAFLLELENRGTEVLSFNPDQAILISGKGPVGAAVDMAQFWPSVLTGSSPEMEGLAKVFARGSVQIGPGQKHVQLLVFRPIGTKFPRRISLQLNRVYYGISVSTIACQFNLRYAKE